MDRNGEVQAASAFSNNTSSVFYCWTHGPGMAFDLHETTSPLTFAAFCNYSCSHRISFEHINNLSGKAKEGTAPETFQCPSFKYGSCGPSYRWYMYPVICHSCTVTSLSNSGCSTFLFDGLGNFNPDVQPGNLLAYPSDNDCVGAVHIHWKMD